MLEKYHYIDQQLFLILNGFHTENLDSFMLLITNKYTSIPIYLLFIVYLYRRFQNKSFLLILGLLASVGLADFITSGLMKPFFKQLRPCHEPIFFQFVNLVGDCGGQFGFASSHASNVFALFSFLLFSLKFRNMWTKFFLFWAILVSFSRIYIGVHYPFDIFVGILVGFLSAFLLFKLLFNRLQPYEKN